MKVRLGNKILNLFNVNYNEKKNIFDPFLFRYALLAITPNALQKNLILKRPAQIFIKTNKNREEFYERYGHSRLLIK